MISFGRFLNEGMLDISNAHKIWDRHVLPHLTKTPDSNFSREFNPSHIHPHWPDVDISVYHDDPEKPYGGYEAATRYNRSIRDKKPRVFVGMDMRKPEHYTYAKQIFVHELAGHHGKFTHDIKTKGQEHADNKFQDAASLAQFGHFGHVDKGMRKAYFDSEHERTAYNAMLAPKAREITKTHSSAGQAYKNLIRSSSPIEAGYLRHSSKSSKLPLLNYIRGRYGMKRK